MPDECVGVGVDKLRSACLKLIVTRRRHAFVTTSRPREESSNRSVDAVWRPRNKVAVVVVFVRRVFFLPSFSYYYPYSFPVWEGPFFLSVCSAMFDRRKERKGKGIQTTREKGKESWTRLSRTRALEQSSTYDSHGCDPPTDHLLPWKICQPISVWTDAIQTVHSSETVQSQSYATTCPYGNQGARIGCRRRRRRRRQRRTTRLGDARSWRLGRYFRRFDAQIRPQYLPQTRIGTQVWSGRPYMHLFVFLLVVMPLAHCSRCRDFLFPLSLLWKKTKRYVRICIPECYIILQFSCSAFRPSLRRMKVY